MPRLTFSQVRQPVARILNLCGQDDLVRDYVNRAQEELLYKGEWPDAIMRYQVCVHEDHITWPRQIEVVYAISLGCRPIGLRNRWFEFLENGPGLLGECRECCQWPAGWYGNTWWAGQGLAVDRGDVVSFADVRGENKRLKIYSTQPADNGKRVLVQYYDDQGQWVRTLDSETNEMVDGEWIELNATTPPETSKLCSSFAGFQKEDAVTQGYVRVYQVDDDTLEEAPLANYEPTEQFPQYRRTYISRYCQQNQANGTQVPHQVTMLGKARHIPVYVDTDYLVISSQAAIINMAKAIWCRDNEQPDASRNFEALAVGNLNDQLKHWQGPAKVILKFDAPTIFGCGGFNHT